MPVPMCQRIYCKKCGTYMKTERFKDVLSPDDIRKWHFSYCRNCKLSFLKNTFKVTFKKK